MTKQQLEKTSCDQPAEMTTSASRDDSFCKSASLGVGDCLFVNHVNLGRILVSSYGYYKCTRIIKIIKIKKKSYILNKTLKVA